VLLAQFLRDLTVSWFCSLAYSLSVDEFMVSTVVALSIYYNTSKIPRIIDCSTLAIILISPNYVQVRK
jgi:hypothetical protein